MGQGRLAALPAAMPERASPGCEAAESPYRVINGAMRCEAAPQSDAAVG